MTNCPNCGAPIDPYKIKCEYCGTWCFDFAAFDFDTDKPVFIKFKTTQVGQPVVITALTKPRLECIEVNSDTRDVTDRMGNLIHSYVASRTCEIDVKFQCIPNPCKDKTLFVVEGL